MIYGLIYKIINKKNKKVYIGQTTMSLNTKIKGYKRDSRKDIETHLFFSIKKYGFKSFEIEQIDTAKSKEELNQKEIFWIAFYDSTNRKKGYNKTFGGEGGEKTEEARRHMSKAQKRRKERDGYIMSPKAVQIHIKRRKETYLKILKDPELQKLHNCFYCPICDRLHYNKSRIYEEHHYKVENIYEVQIND